MKKNEMGGACNTYGEWAGAYVVWWGNLREGITWKNKD